MKKIVSILTSLLFMVSVQGQSRQSVQQVTNEDYEFVLPKVPCLSMEYPEWEYIGGGVQTYRALSFNGLYAFIYNEKHCGYYDVPYELRSGFSSSVRDLQKENGILYWKRVKQIMADIDKYWSEHSSKPNTSYEGNVPDNNHVKYKSRGEGKLFDVVEQMPSYPGGMGALMQYLSSHIKYPVIAEKKGIQGRVICTFIVEEDGSISNVDVARSVHPSLDAEAVRVIYSMPRWVAGRQNGKECRVKFTLPITFKL